MTREELEGRKEQLENSIDSLGSWMLVVVGVVCIGLFIELQIPFSDFFHTFDVRVFLGSIGALLVAGGVAGEFLIEFRAHRREKALRDVNIALDRESARSLKDADERIAEAQRRAQEANERAAVATQKASEANLAAEHERIERIKLEKQFAWRRVAFDQQLRIIAKLKSAGAGHKFLIYVSPDAESMHFMNVIRELLISCGWILVAPEGPITIGAMFTPWIGEGLHLQFAPSRLANFLPIANCAQSAFLAEQIGLNLHANPDVEKHPDMFTLFVGSKPQPPEPLRRIDA